MGKEGTGFFKIFKISLNNYLRVILFLYVLLILENATETP